MKEDISTLKQKFYNNRLILFNDLWKGKRSYDIWWILRNGNQNYPDSYVLNNYKYYYWSALNDHFTTMVVFAYKVFDDRDKTISIRNLKKLADQHFTIDDEELLSLLDSNWTNIEDIWIKIRTLRHCYFAHTSEKLNHDDVFKRANITPNTINKYFDQCLEYINYLSTAYDNKKYIFQNKHIDDFIKLLSDLKSNSV